MKLLKSELPLVIWLTLWAIASLCLLIALMANLCCSNNARRLNDVSSNNSSIYRDRWTEYILGIFMQILLILLLSPIILILAGNEQLSRSITKAPEAVDIIYSDIHNFLKNTHLQISFVITSSTDIAVETIVKDLEGMGNADVFGKALRWWKFILMKTFAYLGHKYYLGHEIECRKYTGTKNGDPQIRGIAPYPILGTFSLSDF
ncbi:hypothetical protein NQ317_019492 [Molorchus minor]|uniref:Uncharacterized protein n=1 Tax=Molorchus minor TaxID=1323400 RepID=A0ABQ9JNV3_9CUCU|nr:hypothetical protein NQ317_019492 [Molorchus minor]